MRVKPKRSPRASSNDLEKRANRQRTWVAALGAVIVVEVENDMVTME